MVRGALEVVEFVPRQVTDADPIDYPDGSAGTEYIWSRLRLEYRTLTSCAAALAAVALHAVLIVPALWASGTPPHPTDRKYAGDTALQWVVLDDSPAVVAARPPPLPAPILAAVGLPSVLPSPELPPSVPAAPKGKNAQSDDQSSLGVMYGRYVGQMHARIDRAWRRPRTSIGAPIFQCQVQIDQDSLGRVGEVTLLQCNGGPRWQLSLVHAIEAASPLPAPPDPAVFVRHVLLEFRAMAYSPGADAQLYEPPGVRGPDSEPGEDELQSQNVFQALRETAKEAHSGKVIELRIEGSKAEVEPEHQ